MDELLKQLSNLEARYAKLAKSTGNVTAQGVAIVLKALSFALIDDEQVIDEMVLSIIEISQRAGQRQKARLVIEGGVNDSAN